MGFGPPALLIDRPLLPSESRNHYGVDQIPQVDSHWLFSQTCFTVLKSSALELVGTLEPPGQSLRCAHAETTVCQLVSQRAGQAARSLGPELLAHLVGAPVSSAFLSWFSFCSAVVCVSGTWEGEWGQLPSSQGPRNRRGF